MRSRYLRLRGLRFHLREAGAADAPLLIYLHGWLDTTATFVPVAQRLAERFRVVALDQRGYGYSEWPQDGYWGPDYVADVDALVHLLAPQSPLTLLGHSMGAHIASIYAGLRPERVGRLALLDGHGIPESPPEALPKRYVGWLDQLQAAPRERRYPSFETLAARIQKQHSQLSAAQALFVARGWGHQDADGQIRLLADPKHRLDMPSLFRVADALHIWRRVTAPTLFVDGAVSPFAKFLPPEERERRRSCFAQREEVLLPAAGHMLHFDQPQALAELLLTKL
jgi:pimeloyl-ACP methyl ester carboxylesterase